MIITPGSGENPTSLAVTAAQNFRSAAAAAERAARNRSSLTLECCRMVTSIEQETIRRLATILREYTDAVRLRWEGPGVTADPAELAASVAHATQSLYDAARSLARAEEHILTDMTVTAADSIHRTRRPAGGHLTARAMWDVVQDLDEAIGGRRGYGLGAAQHAAVLGAVLGSLLHLRWAVACYGAKLSMAYADAQPHGRTGEPACEATATAHGKLAQARSRLAAAVTMTGDDTAAPGSRCVPA